jgi:hypothetical protein
MVGIAAAASSTGFGAMRPDVDSPSAAGKAEPTKVQSRAQQSLTIRCDSARADTRQTDPPPTNNGDEKRYADKRANFTKTLPHDELGEVEPDAYSKWLSILVDGDPSRFEDVPRDPRAVAKLDDPQATYAFDLAGIDSHATHLPPPPAFASGQMATEMAELYWEALAADVPFQNYKESPLIAAALSDLNAFSHPLGPSSTGKITAGTLFRGETAGDLIGPYISQFLWLEIPYGIKMIDQRYRFPSRNQKFLTDYAEWLACQRGTEPGVKIQFDSQPRYICSNRELAEYVHQDFSFQAYSNAALIMLRFGRWLRKHLSLARKAPIITSGWCIDGCARSASLVELKFIVPGEGRTTLTRQSSTAMRSPDLGRHMAPAYCP